jgi:hypothetical protein
VSLSANNIGIDTIAASQSSPVRMQSSNDASRRYGTSAFRHLIIHDEQHHRLVRTEFVQYYNLATPRRPRRATPGLASYRGAVDGACAITACGRRPAPRVRASSLIAD